MALTLAGPLLRHCEQDRPSPCNLPSTNKALLDSQGCDRAYTSMNVLDSAKAFCLFDILIVGVSRGEVKVMQENGFSPHLCRARPAAPIPGDDGKA